MTLAERVYQSMRADIFESKFRADDFFVEQDIAEKYQVSKGTASEALHRLCLEGHLVSYPRKGYRIAILSAKEHRQIQRMRGALESLVIDVVIGEVPEGRVESLYPLLSENTGPWGEYSSQNARFHMGLAELTGDPYIIETLRNLIGALTRTEIYHDLTPEDDTQEYHLGILDAILRKDADAAKECLRKDLGNSSGRSVHLLR